MLPDRSKRYAGTDGDLPRLQLVEFWQLIVIALLMAGLLAVIFPRKALIEKLYGQETLDELTLSYIDNLYRTDPGNADLAILLGRVRRDTLDTAAAETLLMPAVASGNAHQRAEARLLLLGAYERAQRERADAKLATYRQDRILALLNDARRDDVPPQLADSFAASAFRARQSAMVAEFLERSSAGRSPVILASRARDALGAGHHELAAEYFLLARQQVGDRAQAREFFREGIGALMADSRFNQAMQAADRHLGNLADDQPTLRYLMRTALAAGDPQRAAGYARRLLLNVDAMPAGDRQ